MTGSSYPCTSQHVRFAKYFHVTFWKSINWTFISIETFHFINCSSCSPEYTIYCNIKSNEITLKNIYIKLNLCNSNKSQWESERKSLKICFTRWVIDTASQLKIYCFFARRYIFSFSFYKNKIHLSRRFSQKGNVCQSSTVFVDGCLISMTLTQSEIKMKQSFFSFR